MMSTISFQLLFCLALLLPFAAAAAAEIGIDQEISNSTNNSQSLMKGKHHDSDEIHSGKPLESSENAVKGRSDSDLISPSPLIQHKGRKNGVSYDPCDMHLALDRLPVLTGSSLDSIIHFCSMRNRLLAYAKRGPSRILRRNTRDIHSADESGLYLNDPIQKLEPKPDTENVADQSFRWPEVERQSLTEFTFNDIENQIGIIQQKRQPLDRIDEPNTWRPKYEPKYISGRVVDKRQPLDRIDEPNTWRPKYEPKYISGRVVDKRQPLDRIDEPNTWRPRYEPKYISGRVVDKRQPLDRIDEPNTWRPRYEPKYISGRVVDKRQPLDRIDEPNTWRPRYEPKYISGRVVDKRDRTEMFINPEVGINDELEESKGNLVPEFGRIDAGGELPDDIDELGLD